VKGKAKKQLFPSKKNFFSLSGNFDLNQKFYSKNTKFWAGNLSDKTEILSTHNLLLEIYKVYLSESGKLLLATFLPMMPLDLPKQVQLLLPFEIVVANIQSPGNMRV